MLVAGGELIGRLVSILYEIDKIVVGGCEMLA